MAKYINDKRVTDKILEDILNKCGFELIKTKTDKFNGETEINPIMRTEENIMVNCLNKEMSDMANIVYRRFPMLGMFNSGAYSVGEEIVVFDDFFASRIKLTDELEDLDQKLFDVYHDSMCQIFGEEYEKDAQKCFDDILAENKKEDKNSDKKSSEEDKKKEETTSEMGAE